MKNPFRPRGPAAPQPPAPRAVVSPSVTLAFPHWEDVEAYEEALQSQGRQQAAAMLMQRIERLTIAEWRLLAQRLQTNSIRFGSSPERTEDEVAFTSASRDALHQSLFPKPEAPTSDR